MAMGTAKHTDRAAEEPFLPIFTRLILVEKSRSASGARETTMTESEPRRTEKEQYRCGVRGGLSGPVSAHKRAGRMPAVQKPKDASAWRAAGRRRCRVL